MDVHLLTDSTRLVFSSLDAHFYDLRPLKDLMLDTFSFRLVDTGSKPAVKFMEEWGNGEEEENGEKKRHHPGDEEEPARPLNLTARGTSVRNALMYDTVRLLAHATDIATRLQEAKVGIENVMARRRLSPSVSCERAMAAAAASGNVPKWQEGLELGKMLRRVRRRTTVFSQELAFSAAPHAGLHWLDRSRRAGLARTARGHAAAISRPQ